VIGGPDTYATEPAAVEAENKARTLLRVNARVGVTVGEFWDDWTTDPLWDFAPPRRRTFTTQGTDARSSSLRYRDLPLRAVGDEHVAAWLKGGRNVEHRSASCARFSTTPQVGDPPEDSSTSTRSRSCGLPSRPRTPRHAAADAERRSPRFVTLADELTPPSFAAYLQYRRLRRDAARRARRAAHGSTSTSSRGRFASTVSGT
jgi:hypothetical protein